MATKDNMFLAKDKQQKSSFANATSNERNLNHFNLNLNQNLINSQIFPVQSYNKTNFNKQIDVSQNDERKTKLQSFNKITSMNGLCSKTFYCAGVYDDEVKGEAKKQWKKDANSSNAKNNNSTLSIHISAYENLIEASSNPLDDERKDFKMKQERQNLVNKWKTVKQTNICLTPNIQNPFEFPRQQKEIQNPEIMQFKASQKLLYPNESNQQEFRHECAICDTEKGIHEVIQLLNCMHIFCNECIILYKQFGAEVCPQLHCYSTLEPNEEHRLNQESGKKGSGKKEVAAPTLSKCKGAPDCDRVALRNFPSEQECDHDVCLQCLDRMIADCQVSDSMPMCPNERCHLPYRFESVAALKALLPDRAKYFAGLALELNQGYEAIKDEAVTSVQTCVTGFKAKDKILTVKCNVSEDEEGPTIVTYVKDGSLGGFIRELRRAMKIMATDKVYGYFVRRDEGGDEQLVINQSTVQKPISTYKLDSDTLIIIDVTGIVMAKTNANKN